MERVRCGIVGLGRIGSLLEEDRLREKPCTHAGAIAGSRDCALVGGCDVDGRRRTLFSKRWGCGAVFSDLEEMLEKTSPEILHIATPPPTHLGIVRKAVPFGVKVIVCEKPLAPTAEEAAGIAAIHGEGAVRILTNHQRRYSSDYRRARARIEAGALGPLLSVTSRLSMGGTQRAADMLLEDGTHLVDILRFLAGADLKLEAVKLSGTPAPVRDEPPARFVPTVRCVPAARSVPTVRGEGRVKRESLLILGRAGDVPVFIEAGTGRDYVEFELDLSFSAGRIRIGNGLFGEYRSGESPYYEGMRSLVKTGARRPRTTGFFSNMLKDAVRCAREPGREPISSARDGYLAILFIDAVKAALGKGGA